MKNTFSQAMAWLHTWAGLVIGWLLFVIFVGGTIAWNTHQTPSISMNPISSANLPSGSEPTEIQSGGASVPFR